VFDRILQGFGVVVDVVFALDLIKMMIIPIVIVNRNIVANRHKILHNVEQHGQQNAARQDLFFKNKIFVNYAL